MKEQIIELNKMTNRLVELGLYPEATMIANLKESKEFVEKVFDDRKAY